MSIDRWMDKEAVVHIYNGIFSSVQLLSRVWFFAIPWTAEHQNLCPSPTSGACLIIISIKSVMPFNRLILCHPLLLLPSITTIRVFSNELTLHIRWPKYWRFNFSMSPSNEYSGLISFRIDWLELLAVQGPSPVQEDFSGVFSNTTVQKHQFFGTQLSLWSNSHIHTWLLEKPLFWLDQPLPVK